MFSAWGHLVYRFRWAFLIVSAALMALSVAVSASGGDLKSGGIIQTSEAGRAAKLIENEPPRPHRPALTLLFRLQTPLLPPPAYRPPAPNAPPGPRTHPPGPS